MAITAQQLLDAFNGNGIDTVAKLNTFLLVAKADNDALLAAGFTTQGQATAMYTGLKLQQDLSAAQANLSNEREAFGDVEAQYVADKSAAVIVRDAAKAALRAFVVANETVGAAATEHAQLQRDYEAAEIVLDTLDEGFATAQASHEAAVDALQAAIDAAQAAVREHATGA
jgi:hypothetical protein